MFQMTAQNPEAWTASLAGRRFFASLPQAAAATLMLDYDGTLAPFTEGRMDAEPYQGVRERLEILLKLKNTRVLLISGRKAHELHGLIALKHPVEIWGSHGREHLTRDGKYSVEPLTTGEEMGLRKMKDALEQAFQPSALECKPNSVALHWRGAEAHRDDWKHKVHTLYKQIVAEAQIDGRLALLSFDGGIELRAGSTTKGDAVRAVMAQLPPNGCAAFLGDDTTDEDGFLELRRAGLRNGDSKITTLSVLVRKEPRDSYAQIWLKPPDELLDFLDQWISALSDRETSR